MSKIILRDGTEIKREDLTEKKIQKWGKKNGRFSALRIPLWRLLFVLVPGLIYLIWNWLK